MYNPKILSHSVQDVCLGEGEGCLSVDRDVPGYVVRHNKITVSYFDMAGEKHKVRLKTTKRLWFNMKLIILMASCSTIILIKKIHLL